MQHHEKEIRSRLVNRRRILLARYRGELQRIEEELAAHDRETVERATEEWDVQVLSRLGNTDMRAISAVTEAVRRIDEGTYGSCLCCHDPISAARLDAMPETTECIACAKLREPFKQCA